MRNYKRKGQVFACSVCGKDFYRTPGQIKRGATKTCSKACLAIKSSGEGNPFWGRVHTPEAKKRVSDSRKGKCLGNTYATGHKHTEEAKKRIGEASKHLWENHRDKMLASMPRGLDHVFAKLPEERRYRKHFTPRQRREWKDTKCAFCGITEHLELDHIIPIFDKGTNSRSNCQTLCRGCNLWKTKHVDLPRYYAAREAVTGDH